MAMTQIQQQEELPKKGGGLFGGVAGTVLGGIVGALAGGAPGAIQGMSAGESIGGILGEGVSPGKPGSLSDNVGQQKSGTPKSSLPALQANPEVQLASMQNAKQLIRENPVPGAEQYLALLNEASNKQKDLMQIGRNVG